MDVAFYRKTSNLVQIGDVVVDLLGWLPEAIGDFVEDAGAGDVDECAGLRSVSVEAGDQGCDARDVV